MAQDPARCPPHRAMNRSLANHCRWRNCLTKLRHRARMAWYRSVHDVRGLSRILSRTGTRPFWHGGAASSSSCASRSGGGAASSGSCTTAGGWKGCAAATKCGLAWLGGGTWRSAVAGGRNGGIVGNDEVYRSIVNDTTIPHAGHWRRQLLGPPGPTRKRPPS